MELSYPPFEMTDEKGRPSGVSVDLARALAENLHRELVIENIAFDGLIPALKTGKIDVILSSLTRTEERAQSIDFSEPYLETGLCLLVSKASPINAVADLDQPGRKVAVKKGTTGHSYASAHLKKAEVLVLDKEAAAVLEVVQGKVDAFIYDQFSTLQHWQRNDATTRAILKPFQTEQWAMGLRKGNDSLRTSINAFLSDFRKQGGFDRLADRWLKEQKAAFTRQNLPFVF
ncbi:MAG: transporter substrate-binding domain-containing protein [Verrucomicrobiales bacterium]|nr:transporter substrate-binding domain-containing protein [Verrucomicrobiales bacterium]